MKWQVKKLDDVCEVEYGTRVVRKKDGGSKYSVYGGGGATFFMDSFNREDRMVIARFAMSEQCTRFVKGKFFLNDSGLTVSPKNHKELSQEYLDKLLFALNDEIYKLARGTAQKNLDVPAFRAMHIPFPDTLPEQKRIVKILDDVFRAAAQAKENAEKNLANAKALFESYLQNIFANPGKDWEEKKLGDVCDTGAGGTPLKAHKDYYEGGAIPWLRSGEVNKRDIEESEMFITPKGMKNSSARLFPKDTVLVAMYGATAGQVGILRFESTTNQAVCGILPNENFLPEYIYYFFSAGKEALVKQAVGGAQPNISQIKIKNTFIPVLSIKEQQSIVTKLDTLSAETKKLEAIYTQKLTALEELKKSVLKQAFEGKV